MKIVYIMKKGNTFLTCFFLIICALGCKKDPDISRFPEITGSYRVIHYVVGKDTLIDMERGIAKDSITRFDVNVSQAASDSTFYFEFNLVKQDVLSKLTWGESVIIKNQDQYNIYNYFNITDADGGFIKDKIYHGRAVALDTETMGNLITTIKAVKEE
jgi:hypothetical protein